MSLFNIYSSFPDEKSPEPEVKSNEAFSLWRDVQNARVITAKSVNNDVVKQHHSRRNLLVMMNDLQLANATHLYMHALIYAAAITIKPW